MIHEASVILHGGHGPMSGLEYLSRVFLYLVGFTAVATFAYWCFDAVETITAESASEQEIEESESDRERGQRADPMSAKRASDGPERR